MCVPIQFTFSHLFNLSLNDTKKHQSKLYVNKPISLFGHMNDQ